MHPTSLTMKKLLTFLSLLVIVSMTGTLFAQAPQAFNYQAVVRDAQGAPVTDQQVTVRITLLQSGSNIYTETQQVMTNGFGLVNLSIGGGDSFRNIDWSKGSVGIQVDIDPSGGNRFTISGYSDLLSVPYALYAENSGSAGSGETDPNQGIQNLTLFGDILSITDNPNAKEINLGQYLDNTDNQTLSINGQMLTISGGNFVNLPPETDRHFMQHVAATLTQDMMDNWTNGSIDQARINWGTPGAGKVLTSDGNGNATWETQASSIGGSGTANTIPKFATGTTLGNSIITENSDKIGIDDATPEFKLSLDDDGGIMAKGTIDAGTSLTAAGAGTRMFWYPQKAAFRVGGVTGDRWDDVNIGKYSTATGKNTTASGFASVAMGDYTTASGDQSIAIGTSNTASDIGAIAVGVLATASALNSTALGYHATANQTGAMAMGYENTASGHFAVALGYQTKATGQSSVATGMKSEATGYYTTAMGNYTIASGYGSTSMGDDTRAVGSWSTAMGLGTSAGSAGSTAIGKYNVGGGNATSWVANDPLFEIGNGVDDANRANALTVLKNGNMGVGVTDPDATLEVNGQVKITGGTPGAGKVLTSDASGNATWETPASSIGGSGTANTIPKFATGSTLGNSIITESSDKIGIDDATPEFKLSLDDDGGIMAIGTYQSGVALSTTGAGARMFWYPKKAAFRVGLADGTQWDDSNIGSVSMAWGGSTIAGGNYSTAMGYKSKATGASSTAMGENTEALGAYSTAMGYYTEAIGMRSTAMGYYTLANGANSTAMGRITKADSYASVVMGRYNVGGGSSAAWEATDPLFEIGIGADASNKANALTVLKNGNTGIGVADPDAALEVNGQVKITGGTPGTGKLLTSDANGLASWAAPASVNQLNDADTDTKIQVEESVDEDVIRFDIAGTEKMVLTDKALEFKNNKKSVFIGEGAGNSMLGFEEANTFVGYQSGFSCAGNGIPPGSASHNSFFGYQAGYSNTTGRNNTAIGYNALRKNANGDMNTAMGTGALLNNINGCYNIAIGIDALYSNTASGENVAIGAQAGYSTTGAKNIFLGYSAGYNETGSNKLYIENSDIATPLIYGEFDNDKLRVNGTLEVSSTVKIEGGSPGAGKVLTSDANGLASWQTPTAGVSQLSDLSDVNTSTATAGNILIGDGTDFESKSISGDASLASNGALTIANNSVDGTDIALGSDAQGDIMYYNGTDWVRLAAGTSGKILQTNGAGANPTWVDPPSGGATNNVIFKEANYTIQTTDGTIITNGGYTFTLPTASSAGAGKILYLYCKVSQVTINRSGSDTIYDKDGNSGTSDSFWSGVFVSDGVSGWYQVN